ncbi:hypothetical protein HDV00_006625 [Rhizophlyctis rosea]|nr:hypothetical protein HDV00_006625 [Rhizophlyctis rosea]
MNRKGNVGGLTGSAAGGGGGGGPGGGGGGGGGRSRGSSSISGGGGGGHGPRGKDYGSGGGSGGHYQQNGAGGHHSQYRNHPKKQAWGNTPAGGPQHSARPEPKEARAPLRDDAGNQQHNRMLFVLTNLVGMRVEIVQKDGVSWEGIYSASDVESDLHVVLRMARKRINGKEVGKTEKRVIIQFKDLCAVSGKGLDMTSADKPHDRAGFQTDTAISGQTGPIQARELQRWTPSGDDALLGLEDEIGHIGKWDQFEANEKLFGVSTDFDENFYTTQLDRTDPEYRKRELEAMRIAAEIERGPVNNVHIAEERGLAVDTGAMDEEDRYSSVIRQPGKYVPPAVRRTASIQPTRNQPPPSTAAQSVSTQNSPQPPSEPAAKPSQEKSAEKPKPTESGTIMGKLAEDKKVAKELKEQLFKDNKPVRSIDPKEYRNLPQVPKPNAAVLAKLLEKKQPHGSFPPPQPKEGEGAPSPEEVARLFSDFARGEKKNLLQRKQALMKKEKDGIINEFKTFSAQFKLKTPMPTDLQEILKKNGENATSPTSEEPKPVEKANGSAEKAKEKEKAKGAKTPEPKTPTGEKKEAPASAASSSRPATPKPAERKEEEKKAKTSSETKEKEKEKEAKEKAAKEDKEAKDKGGEDAASVVSEASTTNTTKSGAAFKFNLDAAEFKPSSFTPAVPGSPQASSGNLSGMKSPQYGDKSPYHKNRQNKPQNFQNKPPYNKNYQNKNAVNQFGEENMYPQGIDPQQYAYAPYPMMYRPVMGRPPFVPHGMPAMSMPPGAGVPGHLIYAPGFPSPVPPGAHMYHPHPQQMMAPPPGAGGPAGAAGGVRIYPKGQMPQGGGFPGDENGRVSGPPFMSPPPMYSPGLAGGPMLQYTPDMNQMMQFQQPPMMIPGPPWPGAAPEQMGIEMPPPENPQAPPPQPAAAGGEQGK